jgi:hypothetical protein
MLLWRALVWNGFWTFCTPCAQCQHSEEGTWCYDLVQSKPVNNTKINWNFSCWRISSGFWNNFKRASSNIYKYNRYFNYSFTNEEFEDFRPEILVTFGGMIVSKRIKVFYANKKKTPLAYRLVAGMIHLMHWQSILKYQCVFDASLASQSRVIISRS